MTMATRGKMRTHSQSLLQKPIRHITEIEDDPKLDIRKIRRLSGEIEKIQHLPETSPRKYLSDTYYDLLFFLGVSGKHESSTRKTNRTAVMFLVLVIPATVMSYQAYSGMSPANGGITKSVSSVTIENSQYQTKLNSSSVAQPVHSSAQAFAAPTTGDVARASDNDSSGPQVIDADLTGRIEPPIQHMTQPVSTVPPGAEISPAGAESRIRTMEAKFRLLPKAVGRNAAPSDRSAAAYATAEEFWQAHPNFSRSEYTNAFGQSPPPAIKDYWARKGRPLTQTAPGF